MKYKLQIISLLSMICIGFINAQNKFTISGNVKDKKNGEDLIGATVFVSGTSIASSTNAYGFYSLTLNEGKYTIMYQYVGYKTITKEIELTSNLKIDIEISEDKVELQEVVISADKPEDNVRSTEMSVNKLGIRDISKMPALFGEVDVIRSIQFLPGVSSVGEGSSGFNVRGGSIDQNLILLDEAPVYNPSHLFGFFSVFNPDAVKDVKLFKGGIPAQYGGRISSLLDIRLKEGNMKRFSGQGGLGTIFSRLTLEAPIKKDKGSIIVAGRRSYIDALLAPALAGNPDLKGLVLYFYDFTAKANYTLGKRDKIYVSGYFGKDKFGQGNFGFDWGNQTFTTRWNHLFNDKLFFNLTGFYSNYNYGIGAETDGTGNSFSWKSSIKNYSLKPEFTWYLNTKNTISIGGQSTLYDFFPGEIKIVSDGEEINRKLDSKYGLENAVYIANEHKVTPRATLTYGLRFSNFNYISDRKQNYNPDEEGQNILRKPTSTESFTGQTFIQSYWQPEPRFAIKYELNEKSSLKASYMRTVQYLSLVSNTAASIPLDVWTPASNNILPQLGDQIALGYFRNFGSESQFETSVEGYYKYMQNQIDYADNADLLLNPNVEGELMNGRGRAYGLEFYVRKRTGRFNGWISYTLARTERQVDGLNNNDWYVNRFDRTHSLNVVLNYELSKRWSFASNIFYGSGTPLNLHTHKFVYGNGYTVGQSPNLVRNNIRIPDFFRMDLSMTLHNKKRPEISDDEIPKNFFKRLKYTYEWDLVFGIYNTFNMQNAFSLVAREDPSVADNDKVFAGNEIPVGSFPDQKTYLYQKFSVVAFIVPSVTYNFRF